MISYNINSLSTNGSGIWFQVLAIAKNFQAGKNGDVVISDWQSFSNLYYNAI
jgi:hypothetical protein